METILIRQFSKNSNGIYSGHYAINVFGLTIHIFDFGVLLWGDYLIGLY